MQSYEVLVVDDSVFMRKIITDLISEDPQFKVIGAAKNGKQAVEMVKRLRPRVVTMDIEMPEMNGLDALQVIMTEQPTPVVMLSSLTQDGARETIIALERGAIDFIGKPSGSISLDLRKVQTALLEKLRVAVKADVTKFRVHQAPAWKPSVGPQHGTEAKQTITHEPRPIPTNPLNGQAPSQVKQVIAIGTSTGGPRALHQVISNIPAHLPAPIVIVQHMPPNFTKSLAQRLDSVSNVCVVEAKNGMILQNGVAYVAPGGFHMSVARNGTGSYKIHISKEEPRGGHRPSVDTLFESLLPFKELKRHIVLMTGMGSDGAKGMLALKNAGAVTTIAESEETCIVYGMPRAAVELNCVTHVLNQQDIAQKLAQAVLR
ncbi:protein-glutamate methylesterase/protein-glutamine glutaminase [Paenibacillus xerothermodurans]|uniref:Protein-glutamate methylesterase/protein-glutamine glutaminase n=1 Tax=Paenibacillus xerothermodurans TaxID=1977292 RepID=A0A2W1NER3_PAEXE|nr:chemotaxis response regulator protein-glutamate methylesterase [Paenibacillus xerothermodurans]PZE22434.1 chemotaxis response regulator protein-glutamate methylesterase [Paenibacillus xerothermodurans]